MIKNILFFFFTLFVAQAHAKNFDEAKIIIVHGNSKGALACMTCHQENGSGNPGAGIPQLAGMNAIYFSKQIYDFQNLQRINPIMQSIAKGLSKNEIENLADYFSSLPNVESPNVLSAHFSFQLGQVIAEKGLWHKGVPSCFSCHGPSGRGVGETFPAITTQGKLYLVQQLKAWNKGSRKNDPNQLMATVAKKLTQKEIDAVAEFLTIGTSEEKK